MGYEREYLPLLHHEVRIIANQPPGHGSLVLDGLLGSSWETLRSRVQIVEQIPLVGGEFGQSN
jgi:hypothetical protein